MSTIPTGATNSGLLGTLASINGEVQLAVMIGGVVVPLVKGIIKDIKGMGTTTIDFTLDVTNTQAELAAIAAVEIKDLADINAELIRLGKTPIPTS